MATSLTRPIHRTPTPQSYYLSMGKEALAKSIKALCRDNFLVFLKMELGCEVWDHHQDWWNIIRTGADCVFLSPRDHGKSYALARAFPIWKAKYDKRVKEIYILGADRDSAVENLDKMKTLLESKPSLASLVPDTRSEGINSRTELRLMNGVSIKAKGYMSPLRGRHPQLIVLDDVLNQKNSDSADSRARMIKYFYEVVLPMKDKGMQKDRDAGFKSQIIVIGTAQHREDLYFNLLGNQMFRGLRQKAIIDDEKQQVLWPSRYPYLDLMKMREGMGSLIFSKEYQNEPLSDDTSLFPASLFESLKDHDLSYVRSYRGSNPVYLGADFSVPGSCDGDWTSFFVFEEDTKTKMITPLWYYRAKPDSMQEQLIQLEYLCNAYGVGMGYLEDNMFQRVYAEHFRNRTALPLKGHTVSHSGKNSLETGILSFRPLFENGKVRFPYKTAKDRAMTDHIIQEFNGVVQKKGRIGNDSFHDDVAMSFWHALRASREMTSFSYEMIG